MHQADQQDLEKLVIGANASMFRAIDPKKIDHVFHPSNIQELKEAIQYANNKNLTITPKGGGTSLSGACTGGNETRIIISSNNLRKIVEFDPNKNAVRVEPGITPRKLNQMFHIGEG